MTAILDFLADKPMAFFWLAIIYFLLAHTPVWLAVVFSIWPTKLKRRWLFVGVSSALTYGLLVFGATAVVIPIEALGVFEMPEWKRRGYYENFPPLQWLASATEFIWNWWFLAWPVVCGLVGWFVVSRLARRWNAIVEANAH